MMVEDSSVVAHYDAMRERGLDHLAPLFAEPRKARRYLLELPVVKSDASHCGWQWLTVPAWAKWVLPGEVDAFFLPMFSQTRDFRDYPWWRAIDFYIGLEWERACERRYGPTHSYSHALGKEVSPAFDFAWVNRIAAFLKAWSAHRAGLPVEQMFGVLPVPRISLTHDVDAVEMTMSLKVKQAVSRAMSGQLRTALRILRSKRDSRFLETLLDLEESVRYRSLWLFYAKPPSRGAYKRHPLDPNYSLFHERVSWLMPELVGRGHAIGVHSSFNSWRDANALLQERNAVAERFNTGPRHVRQHWLRFGTATTWEAQREAGFLTDYTLGFNDRPGFRASTALPLTPTAGGMIAIPTMLMDSNLFGAQFRSRNSREAMIDHLLDEVEDFGGHVAINWHPHTLDSAYGWAETYRYLLAAIGQRRLEVVI